MTELSPAAQAVLDAYRDADIDDEATASAVLPLDEGAVAFPRCQRTIFDCCSRNYHIYKYTTKIRDLHAFYMTFI